MSMSYKILVYEFQDSGKLKRISEFLRDPETKKFFTRAGAQAFAKHLFTHEYDQEKFEIYVEPVAPQTSSLVDGAKPRAKKPTCVKSWQRKVPGLTKREALRMCESVGNPLKYSRKAPTRKDMAVAIKLGDVPIDYEKRVERSLSGEPRPGREFGVAGTVMHANCKQLHEDWPKGSGKPQFFCDIRPAGLTKPWSDVEKSGAKLDPYPGSFAKALADSAANFMSTRSKSRKSGSHKLRRVGTSRKCHQCDKCGKTGLKQTCVMERSGDKARFHYGSECAKRKSHDKLEEKWFTYKDWIKDVEERVVDHLVSAPTPIWNREARKLFNEHKRKTSEALLERWKAHEPAFSVALDIAETLIPKARRESRHKHTLAMEEFESPKPVPTWEGKCLEEMISSGIAKNQREAFYLCIQAQQAGIAPRELVKRIKSKKGRWLIPVGLGVGLVAGLGISKAAGVI